MGGNIYVRVSKIALSVSSMTYLEFFLLVNSVFHCKIDISRPERFHAVPVQKYFPYVYHSAVNNMFPFHSGINEGMPSAV